MIVLAVVSLMMLIFIAVVTWKLVSLDKALAEERQRNGMYSLKFLFVL